MRVKAEWNESPQWPAEVSCSDARLVYAFCICFFRVKVLQNRVGHSLGGTEDLVDVDYDTMCAMSLISETR